MATKRDCSELAKTRDVAEYLQTTEGHLVRMRFERRGPAYVRVGRAIRYRWSDVEHWVAENVIGGE